MVERFQHFNLRSLLKSWQKLHKNGKNRESFEFWYFLSLFVQTQTSSKISSKFISQEAKFMWVEFYGWHNFNFNMNIVKKCGWFECFPFPYENGRKIKKVLKILSHVKFVTQITEGFFSRRRNDNRHRRQKVRRQCKFIQEDIRRVIGRNDKCDSQSYRSINLHCTTTKATLHENFCDMMKILI